MKLIYENSESTIKPLTVEVGKTTVYLRKDIKMKDNTPDSLWTYQEAKLTHEEFNEYSKVLAASNAISNEEVPNNISQLVSGQANGDNNQLIIMEAIADLYDVITEMMLGGSV